MGQLLKFSRSTPPRQGTRWLLSRSHFLKEVGRRGSLEMRFAPSSCQKGVIIPFHSDGRGQSSEEHGKDDEGHQGV